MILVYPILGNESLYKKDFKSVKCNHSSYLIKSAAMSKECCENPAQMEIALKKDTEMAQFFRDGFGSKTYFNAQIGSAQARTLEQYKEILHHNGALDIFAYAQANFPPDLTVVDSGCATAFALSSLRPTYPQAHLVGIDIQNAPQMGILLRDEGIFGEELFDMARVNFIQDSYTNINTHLPKGFDLLVSVFAFDDSIDLVLQSHVLREYYRGLHKGGLAQVFIQYKDLKGHEKLLDCLGHNDIPFSYIEADPNFLGVGNPKSPWFGGTLTMGPKLL